MGLLPERNPTRIGTMARSMIPFACLIPARMESQRYPGKALAMIEGQAMVVRCAHNAMHADLKTWVCTDSEQIEQVCRQKSIHVIKTPRCNSGTDRCAWAIKQIDAEHIIILQGDEPLVQPEELKLFQEKIETSKSRSNLLFNGITGLPAESFSDFNVVKASCHSNQSINALTRSIGENHQAMWKRQMGLYGGLATNFIEFAQLPPSPAEEQNSIEMLRWLDHGRALSAVELRGAPYSVDTPDDMDRCHLFLQKQQSPSSISGNKKAPIG